jgi:hypothetical protein
MIHPETELRFISPALGSGIFATGRIPAGTMIWVPDGFDRVYSPSDRAQLDEAHREVLDTYSYRNAAGDFVFCWDHTRFVNHSFFANCLPTPYGVEIAVKDIKPGEELTNDYGCLNLLESFTPLDEGHARKEVTPDDFLIMHAEWDRAIAAALKKFPAVHQPLRSFLRFGIEERLLSIAFGKCPSKSILKLYYRGNKSGGS